MVLTSEHAIQLECLASQTGLPWEAVLDEALSEYRSVLALAPPAGFTAMLDTNVCVQSETIPAQV